MIMSETKVLISRFTNNEKNKYPHLSETLGRVVICLDLIFADGKNNKQFERFFWRKRFWTFSLEVLPFFTYVLGKED